MKSRKWKRDVLRGLKVAAIEARKTAAMHRMPVWSYRDGRLVAEDPVTGKPWQKQLSQRETMNSVKKSDPKGLINCWPGDLLREEFMKPLGLSAAAIAVAMPRRVYPKGPVLPPAFWERKIKILIGEEDGPFEDGPDPLLFVALERCFLLSAGFFLRVWCEAAHRAVSKRHAAVLKRIKPIDSAKTEDSRTLGREALKVRMPTRPKQTLGRR